MNKLASQVGETDRVTLAAVALTGLSLYMVVHVGVLGALLAGLLTFHLVRFTEPLLLRMGINRGGRTIALALLAALFASLLWLGILGLRALLTSGPDNLAVLLGQLAAVIDTARARLPAEVQDFLPADVSELQSQAAGWLRSHAVQVGMVSQDVARVLVHILLGTVVGGLIAVQASTRAHAPGPLAAALTVRARILAGAFRRVVFSQIRISALNTTMTALYLAFVLPLFDVHLPLVKTMVAVTFIAGLLPIIGNLISNTVIFLISLSVSGEVAIASLAYLVLIHKLEYFFNARIIGGQIGARAWEMLAAMILMEAWLGIPGLIAAPIYYAYVKDELKSRGLI